MVVTEMPGSGLGWLDRLGWPVGNVLPSATMASDSSPNTVHFSTLMAFLMLMGGNGLFVRCRSGKLLIFRLTARGLRRLRLEMTRSWRISSSTAL
jgi:hypothetical protein